MQIGHALGTSDVPYLVNLNPDPTLSESLLYYLREGPTGFCSRFMPVILIALLSCAQGARR